MKPNLTKVAIRRALRQFDSTLRDTREWTDWDESKAHKWAIAHAGRKYPVKDIVSLASGVPVDSFSGGRYPGHANQWVAALGFRVVPLHVVSADWSRDELILALDLYLRHRQSPPGKTSKEIRDLSRLLKRLGDRLFASWQRADTFRNENGVYMKLMNLRRLDPLFTSSGKKGLTSGSAEEEAVWLEFASDPGRCSSVARAIIASIDDNGGESAAEPTDDGEDDASEGRLLTRKHLLRERSAKLVARKKNQVMRAMGKLRCEACGFDFATFYGMRGQGFIECHHTKPVATLEQTGRTHLRDLAILCANCHRIVHRGRPWLTVAELKGLLEEAAPPVRDSAAVTA